jgi:hypothetical protein
VPQLVKRKLEAAPVGKIIDKSSGIGLGVIYLWNTGEYAELWYAKRQEDVTLIWFNQTNSGKSS